MAGATSAMLADGRILIAGGSYAPSIAQRVDIFSPRALAEARNPWSPIDTGISRRYGSAVLLPDESVLLINGHVGSPETDAFDCGDGWLGNPNVPQIVRTNGQQPAVWSGRAQAEPAPPRCAGDPADAHQPPDYLPPCRRSPVDTRGYHASALLLPDGSVLVSSGSEGCGNGGERSDSRYYYPPYLDPRLSQERPRVAGLIHADRQDPLPLDERTGLPTLPRGSFRIRVENGPVSRVTLMALGAMTHAIDMNQRIVPLAIRTDGDLVTATVPDGRATPSGPYMLFVLRRVPLGGDRSIEVPAEMAEMVLQQ